MLQGDLNESRLALIKKAYEKLDVNKDGLVTLDDIAKIYDVSNSMDVQSGRKSAIDVYNEFMSMWQTQQADGIVTFDEFCDYFKDISASSTACRQGTLSARTGIDVRTRRHAAETRNVSFKRGWQW